jgi:mono/diheme cytochrome c family protein
LLPIDFGGKPAAVGKVVSPSEEVAKEAEDEEKPLPEVVVTLTTADGKPVEPLPVGSQVAWTGGTYEGNSHRVKAFDPKTGQVTLAGLFDDGLPEAGDECLVDAGTALAEGRKLYALHCLHCHGPGGAGDGPTAKYLDPRPRDFRLGTFKFKSTAFPEKPSREDLTETLKRGIPGTSMPAFRLLSDEELHKLVEYVRWLAMHGEYENQLTLVPYSSGFTQAEVAKQVAAGKKREEIVAELQEVLTGDLVDTEEVAGEDISDAWKNANEPEAEVHPAVPRTPDTPESRARGRQLYLSEKTKCATCHGPYGRGDGPQTEAFNIIPGTSETYPRPGLYDDWNNPVRPRDLTQGVFRGGRRPIDVYRRIRAGIKGTPMPAFSTLTDEEVWDIVNYVLDVPYETLPEPGKGKSLVSTGH